MAMITCPYCNMEVNTGSAEAEDGYCPECGAVIAASSLFHDENSKEFDDAEDDELDDPVEDDEIKDVDIDEDFEDFDEDFEEEDEGKKK